MNPEMNAAITVSNSKDPTKNCKIPLDQLSGFSIKDGLLRIRYKGSEEPRDMPLGPDDQIMLRGSVEVQKAYSVHRGEVTAELLFVNKRLMGAFPPGTFNKPPV